MAGAAALPGVALLVLVRPSEFALPSLLEAPDWRLAAALALYALSHLFRVARLVTLVHTPAVRVRRLVRVHLMATGLGMILPFKLSEAVRVVELGAVLGSVRTGLLAVWLERTFDAAVLLVLVAITAAGIPAVVDLLGPLLVVLATFVVLTVVAITILPENLRTLMLHLVRRPSGERTIPLLHALRIALDTLHDAPRLLRGRMATLVVLTVLVWATEVAVVSVAVPGAGDGLREIATAMLSVLSTVSSGGTALWPSSGDALRDALAEGGLSGADVDLYRLALVLFALVAGPVGAAQHLLRRGRAA